MSGPEDLVAEVIMGRFQIEDIVLGRRKRPHPASQQPPPLLDDLCYYLPDAFNSLEIGKVGNVFDRSGNNSQWNWC